LPLKYYYYKKAVNLAFFLGMAFINKQLAIYYYKVASKKAFIPKNIRSGFFTTGIILFNPNYIYCRLRLKEEINKEVKAEGRPLMP
jgi:hypothetical protein